MYLEKLPIINGKRVLNDDFVNNQMKKIAIEIGNKNKNVDLSFILEGFCGENLEDVDMSGLSLENFRRLKFDSNTNFPNMQVEGISIKEFAENLINQGKSFLNVIEEDEAQGKVDGAGTTIALLDTYFDSSIKEFEGRVVKHIVFTKGNNDEVVTNVAFDRDNKDIRDKRDVFLEKYGDGSHGNTTACLAAGKECGIAPGANLYIFSVGDVDWDKAKEAMLKYMKENIEIPDVISISADIKNTKETENILEEFRENYGCIDIDSSKFWQNFLWGRISIGGKEIKIDELMQEIIKGYDNYPEDSKARKVIDNMNNNIALPFTQRTTVHYGKDGKPIYEYNGTICGASYAIPQIAGLILKCKQQNKSITYEEFVNYINGIVKNRETIKDIRNWDKEINKTISGVQLDEVNSVTIETKTNEKPKTNEERRDSNDNVKL